MTEKQTRHHDVSPTLDVLVSQDKALVEPNEKTVKSEEINE